MNDRHFHPPVEVIAGPDGHSIMHVNTTRQAAEMLLFAWPGKGGPKARTARQACLDVLQGQREAAAARKAFRDAAEEADIILVTKGVLTREGIR